MADNVQPDLTTLTVQLLSAYFANNSVPSNEIAGLIGTTRTALLGKVEPQEPEAPEYVPAVSVRKSLGSRDHIISMVDGRPYKTLKRHLAGHGLTPAEYRSRYNLPADYPMVAAGYSEHRREVAKRLGLGRKSAAATAETEESVAASTEASKGSQTELAPVADAPAEASPQDVTSAAPTKKSGSRRRAATPAAEPKAAAAATPPVEAKTQRPRRKTKDAANVAVEAAPAKPSTRRLKNPEPAVPATPAGRRRSKATATTSQGGEAEPR